MTVKQKTPLLTRLLLKCLSHAPPFGLVYHISLKFPTPLAKKRQKPIGFCLFLVEISGIEPLTSWMPFKRSPSWAIPPYMGEAQDFDFQFWWGVLVHACTRLPAELYPYVQFLLFCWPNELYFSRVLPICQLLFCFFANRARRARVLCNLGVERYSGLL